MESKREQAYVGLFVLVVAALLIATIFVLSGTLEKSDTPYHAYFKNAGGLGPGAEVRYLNGPPVGRVQKVQFDPQDSSRMKVDFTAKPNIPIKTDSVAIVTSTSPLGENFLGILAGSPGAQRAQPNAVLKSKEPVSFSDIADKINELTPVANELLTNLNARVVELKVTLARVNDLLNDENRENVSATLSNLRGMLQENRPVVRSALNHVNDDAADLKPLIASFQKASEQANQTLQHLDAVITENRPDIRQAIIDLKAALANVDTMVASLNNTVTSNSENLDEIIDNLRHVTENLNSFTEQIKTRPYSIIRAADSKPHKPGSPPPK